MGVGGFYAPVMRRTLLASLPALLESGDIEVGRDPGSRPVLSTDSASF